MPVIETTNLEKIYYNDGVATPALRGVTFAINSGEFVAITGASGSGKSTLLHILGFLDRHTGGEYRFDGKTIDDYSKTEIAEVRNGKMGFVFQMFNLLPRATVFENVKLPLLYSRIPERDWDNIAEKAIEAVGLSGRINHEAARLSGGEKQRAAIARSLVTDPEVIFADEPTGNLDSKSGQTVMTILQKLNLEDKRTIVLITHETYTAEHAERVINLRDGKIESDDPVPKRRFSDHFMK